MMKLSWIYLAVFLEAVTGNGGKKGGMSMMSMMLEEEDTCPTETEIPLTCPLPEGNVITACKTVLEDPGLYTLSNDLLCTELERRSTRALTITGDDITLDCQGHTISQEPCQKSDTVGIQVGGDNVILVRCNIECYERGIDGGESLLIKNANITNNRRGIRTLGSGTVRVIDSEITDSTELGIEKDRGTLIVVDTVITGTGTPGETDDTDVGNGIKLLNARGSTFLSGVSATSNAVAGLSAAYSVTNTRDVVLHDFKACGNGVADVLVPPEELSDDYSFDISVSGTRCALARESFLPVRLGDEITDTVCQCADCFE